MSYTVWLFIYWALVAVTYLAKSSYPEQFSQVDQFMGPLFVTGIGLAIFLLVKTILALRQWFAQEQRGAPGRAPQAPPRRPIPGLLEPPPVAPRPRAPGAAPQRPPISATGIYLTRLTLLVENSDQSKGVKRVAYLKKAARVRPVAEIQVLKPGLIGRQLPIRLTLELPAGRIVVDTGIYNQPIEKGPMQIVPVKSVLLNPKQKAIDGVVKIYLDKRLWASSNVRLVNNLLALTDKAVGADAEIVSDKPLEDLKGMSIEEILDATEN